MITYDESASFGKLYESMSKSRTNVLWKDSVSSFDLNAIERCCKLSSQLKDNSYKPSVPYTFKITSPKEREIVSIGFRDRVYQRSLNDNILYPIMTKSLIYDNCACQIGKGTDFARNRLKLFLGKNYRSGMRDSTYILQIDIKGYYPNMNHQKVEEMFQKKLDNKTFSAVRDILHRQYPSDVGYNPGSQLIQIAGISFLDDLDHLCKERLKCRFYIRYMDDIVIFNKSKDEAESRLDTIQKFLATKCFETNKKKTKIYLLSKGIMFLGFKFLITETGKIVMLIKSESVKRERKHLRNLVRRCKSGKIPRKQVDECFQSWIAYAEKGNSYYLINRMKKYYRGLWSFNDSKEV